MSTPANRPQPIKERLKALGAAAVRSHSRRYFLEELIDSADVFDIGCGNDSPFRFKSVRPDIRYVRLDVAVYNHRHDPTEFADEYISVPAEDFLRAIESARTSSMPWSARTTSSIARIQTVLSAMARALRPGGRIYLSSRRGDAEHAVS